GAKGVERRAMRNENVAKMSLWIKIKMLTALRLVWRLSLPAPRSPLLALRPSPFALRPSLFALRPSPFALPSSPLVHKGHHKVDEPVAFAELLIPGQGGPRRVDVCDATTDEHIVGRVLALFQRLGQLPGLAAGDDVVRGAMK